MTMKPSGILKIVFSCVVLALPCASLGQPAATAPHDLSVSDRGTWTKWADSANGLPASGTVFVSIDPIDHNVVYAYKPPGDTGNMMTFYSARLSDPKPAFKVFSSKPKSQLATKKERAREQIKDWPLFTRETCICFCPDSHGRLLETAIFDRYSDNHVYASPYPLVYGSGNWTPISDVSDFCACPPPVRPDGKFAGGPPLWGTNAPQPHSALGWIKMAGNATPWGEMFLGTELAGFWHSFDDGKTWSNIDPNFYQPQRDASGFPAYQNPGYPDPAAGLHGSFGNSYPTVILTKNSEVLLLNGYNTSLYTSDGRTALANIPMSNHEAQTRHGKIYDLLGDIDVVSSSLKSGEKIPMGEILEWDDVVWDKGKPPYTALTSNGAPFTPAENPVTPDGLDIYVGSTNGEIWKWTSTAPLLPVVKMDANKTVTCPGPVTVSGAVADGPWKYQWRARGPGDVIFSKPLAASTEATFNAPGDYVLNLRAINAATSTGNCMVVHVTAKEGGEAPKIVTQPAPTQVLAVGKPAAFAVTASGTAPLQYQWFRNGFKIVGATAATYTIPNATAGDNGATFHCVVSSPYGRVAGNCAALGLPPQIVANPPNQTAAAGQSVTFSVAAGGTEPLTWQWRKNGVDIPKANKPSLTIKSAQESDAGAYSVVVNNILGSVVGSNATLAIGDSAGQLYKLMIKSQSSTVTDGGSYAAGTVVPIFTGPHRMDAGGEKFTGWKAQPAGAQIGDASANATTIVMPAADVTVTASDSGIPPGVLQHRLTVVNGIGAGSFSTDAQVTIEALEAPAGMAFDHWSGGPTGVDGAVKPTLTFPMPASNIAVWATYKPSGNR
jgi:hypothetical protein